jgi:multidrug efflux pump subunit AcrA (membrane-fusion protein)
MKLNRKQILPALLALLVLAAAGYWLLAPRESRVETISVEMAPASRILAVNGRIRPRLQVDIRPALGGELVALPFDVGDRVAAGQILAGSMTRPKRQRLPRQRHRSRRSRPRLPRPAATLPGSRRWGSSPPGARSNSAACRCSEGARELSRRRAAVVQAREQRDRRVLRAPFAGVILERPVDPGQTVGLDSVIYRLADLTAPEVTVEVDEAYAAEIRPGMEARVSFPGQAGELRAAVAHVEPRVDPATGARDVRLTLVDGAAIEVPSGLTVTVNLVIERRDRAISVPRSALILGGDAAKVRLVGKDGVVSERAVSFIDWPAETVIVTRGLAAGERLLADPEAAQPGEKVRTGR